MNFNQGTLISDVDGSSSLALTQEEGEIRPDVIAVKTLPGSHHPAEVPTVTATAAFNFSHSPFTCSVNTYDRLNIST